MTTGDEPVVPDDFEGRVSHSFVIVFVLLLELGWIKIFRDFFSFFFFLSSFRSKLRWYSRYLGNVMVDRCCRSCR